MILGKLCLETMRLEALTRVILPLNVKGPLDFDIEGISYDSRQARKNHLFVALPGTQQDGAAYIDDAIRRGAVAVVAEADLAVRRDVALVHVDDARLALAELSCAFYDRPSERLETIGITGTNGKTTTSFMCREILRADGRATGLIGTVRYEMGSRVIPAGRTTPEAPDIQFMLDQMLRAGCRSAVMEVSSHALDQRRVWGIDFDVGVFTNLTRDHLDYHATMPNYFLAKSKLFAGLGQMTKDATAVVNMDDAWGQELAGTPGLRANLVTYGIHEGAQVRAEDLRLSADGSVFLARTPWGDAALRLPLLGRYNVSNALAAFAACASLGVPPATIARALAAMPPVPGRLEPVPNTRGLRVFVDYAHTDDALENVLTTLRELAPRRLIVVFGCGGNRDRTKRPLMGAVAERLADHVIVTSDNPRHEDPEAIIREIAAGMITGRPHETVVLREEAIARALAMAVPGDMVLIAGKGHENYQDFGATVVPFEDREIVRQHLRG